MKGVSPEDFVANHLADQTDDDVLSNDDTRQEIIDAIAYKPPKGGSAKKGGKDGGEQNAIQKKLADIKAVMDKLPESDIEGEMMMNVLPRRLGKVRGMKLKWQHVQ